MESCTRSCKVSVHSIENSNQVQLKERKATSGNSDFDKPEIKYNWLLELFVSDGECGFLMGLDVHSERIYDELHGLDRMTGCREPSSM
eukprot:83546-Rhodomonas_salina.2